MATMWISPGDGSGFAGSARALLGSNEIAQAQARVRPPAAMDEDGGFVFGENDVGTGKGRARRSARAVSYPTETRRARSDPPYLNPPFPIRPKRGGRGATRPTSIGMRRLRRNR